MTREIGQCLRCKKEGLIVNSLLMQTDEKGTTILLCDVCLVASRKIWYNFIKEGSSNNSEGELNDSSLMYFGKYKGKPMSKVPGHYLLWISEQSWVQQHPRLMRYINRNRRVLEAESD